MNMKKQVAFIVVGVVVFVAGYAVHNSVSAAGDCQKPSGNTKACYKPDNAVKCPTLVKSECGLSQDWGEWKTYEIEKIPIGATEANSGLTTEEQVDCWRYSRCKWDDEKEECVKNADWTPWVLEWKTVVDPDGICPES
jgi:hypothetical protein